MSALGAAPPCCTAGAQNASSSAWWSAAAAAAAGDAAEHGGGGGAFGRDEAARAARSCDAKSRSRLAALSLRGAACGRDARAVMDGVRAAVAHVGFEDDAADVYAYPDDQMIPWMRSRRIASAAALEALDANALMWEDSAWGLGRDMVPFLVLTHEELGRIARPPAGGALRTSAGAPSYGGAVEAPRGFLIGRRIK